MGTMRAVIVDPTAPGRLAVGSVAAPVPGPAEAVVRVAAISLNPGELRNRARFSRPGWRPGRDFAGIVDGGTFAELVAARTGSLAALPEAVTFAQAATLPVAGLTALLALERGGLLLGRAVLITGASGGVGHLACQLARAAGARVVGVVRRPDRAALVEAAGALAVSDLAAARAHGPYHLVLDSVGADTLAQALELLGPGGVCVTFGSSAGGEATVNLNRFYLTGGTTLYGFYLFDELARRPAGAELARLAALVADERLRPHIAVEAPWTEIANSAQQLLDRDVPGKIVLHVTVSLGSPASPRSLRAAAHEPCCTCST